MDAIDVFRGGLSGLTEYLSLHVISCLIPAMFIAGAISAFASQAAILKYFGTGIVSIFFCTRESASLIGNSPGSADTVTILS